MKRLLFIASQAPFPAYNGGKIKTLHTIKLLSRHYQVDVVFQTSNKDDYTQTIRLGKLIKRTSWKGFINPNLGFWQNTNFRLKSLLHVSSPYLSSFNNPTMQKYISLILKLKTYSTIHIDNIAYVPSLPTKQYPIVYEEAEILYILMLQKAKQLSSLFSKSVMYNEAFLTFLYEYYWYQKLHTVFSVSTEDEQIIRNQFHISRCHTILFNYYPVNISRMNEKNNLLFIANLEWFANQDALLWFCNEIFPLIKVKHPNCIFHIIGKIPKNIINQIQSLDHIQIHGFLLKIPTHIIQSSISVFPFRIGSGLRLKALYALTQGIPIISTKLGISGLPLQKNYHYLPAETVLEFIHQISCTVKDPTLCRTISTHGRIFVKQYFNNKYSNKKLLNIYDHIMNN